MRALWIGVLAFVICFAALQIVYPWATYYGNFEFGWWRTMISYLLVAVLLGIIAWICASLFLGRPTGSPFVRGVGCGLTTFVFAVMFSLLFGIAGLNVPDTRVRGIFFAELEFVNFIGCVALPVAIFSAALCGWSVWKQSKP
jgi:hypothetical protein